MARSISPSHLPVLAQLPAQERRCPTMPQRSVGSSTCAEDCPGSIQLRGMSDLARAVEMPDACWAAINAPVAGLSCDARVLAMLDNDGNGSIRIDEMREAIRWSLRVFRDHRGFEEGWDRLYLEDLDDDDEIGRALRAAAQRVLTELDPADSRHIGLEQIQEYRETRLGIAVRGDGFVALDNVEEPDLHRFMSIIIASVGAPGARGVDGATLERFCAEARQHLALLGDMTGARAISPAESHAYACFAEIQDKIDDFFRRCRLLALDPRAAEAMRVNESALEINLENSAELQNLAKRIPLQPPIANGSLDIDGAMNPLYEDAFLGFRRASESTQLGSIHVQQGHRLRALLDGALERL